MVMKSMCPYWKIEAVCLDKCLKIGWLLSWFWSFWFKCQEKLPDPKVSTVIGYLICCILDKHITCHWYIYREENLDPACRHTIYLMIGYIISSMIWYTKSQPLGSQPHTIDHNLHVRKFTVKKENMQNKCFLVNSSCITPLYAWSTLGKLSRFILPSWFSPLDLCSKM